MKGDALASGQKSATFPVSKTSDAQNETESGFKKIQVGTPRLFAQCKDCDGEFFSASAFSEHLEYCKPK